MITKDTEKKLFLLDAFALIYRSYFAFTNNPRVNSKGFNTSIPFGGQTHPIETAGERLEWKNAQKNPTKNIISETIKRITP